MTQHLPARNIGLLTLLYRVFCRDILITWRRRADIVSVLFFFIITASLFPLGSTSDATLLHNMAPGVLWVCALLSCMLSLPRLFAADYADGSLEKLLMASQPPLFIMATKTLAHWTLSGLPLVIIAPLIGLQFNLSPSELKVLALSLLLGTPILSLIGSIGAALTLGVRSGGVLVALLILPLYMPVLVFGAGAVNAVSLGIPANGGLYLLGAMLACALLLAPIATYFALKIALE